MLDDIYNGMMELLASEKDELQLIADNVECAMNLLKENSENKYKDLALVKKNERAALKILKNVFEAVEEYLSFECEDFEFEVEEEDEDDEEDDD